MFPFSVLRLLSYRSHSIVHRDRTADQVYHVLYLLPSLNLSVQLAMRSINRHLANCLRNNTESSTKMLVSLQLQTECIQNHPVHINCRHTYFAIFQGKDKKMASGNENLALI